MAFVIDESFLPATLTAPPMTDEQFAAFCSAHPDLFFEMTATGEILVMPPNYTLRGIRNREIVGQLDRWSSENARGVVGDASTGFVLGNGARRSPDAAWIARTQIERLSKQALERYWHLCPDFVIELRSHTDRLPVLRDKMHEWIANGAQLGWLIDPENRTVEIFRPNCQPELLKNVPSVAAGRPVDGFVLTLGPVWDPL